MNKDDKITCIGATGKAGTKVQCFTPNNPQYSEIQYKVRLLVDDIKDYNKLIGKKYKVRSAGLRGLLESIGSPTYPEKIRYATSDELQEKAVRAEETARRAEADIKTTEAQVNRATEAVKSAQIALNKAVTEDERREVSINIRTKEEEARRAAARVIIERGLAKDARNAANIATFSAETFVTGTGQVATESREATKHLQEGADLARRRNSLVDEIKEQMHQLAAPEEWKALKRVNGFVTAPFFSVHPNMFNKCRILWETLEEELPFEL